MRFSLKTFLVLAMLAPPLLAGFYLAALYVWNNERAQMLVVLLGAIAVWAVLKSVLAPDPRIDGDKDSR
jgi:hypothetical protein